MPHFQQLRGHPNKNKDTNTGVKRHHRSNVPYRHLQNSYFQQPMEVSLKDNTLRHKENLNKYWKIKINPCIQSVNNGIKLETSSKGIIRKYTHSWALNKTPPNVNR